MKHHPGLYDVLHNYHVKKKKKKQQERLARNLSKEGVQVLILILFHASPNSQKKIILLTENGNPKH